MVGEEILLFSLLDCKNRVQTTELENNIDHEY